MTQGPTPPAAVPRRASTTIARQPARRRSRLSVLTILLLAAASCAATPSGFYYTVRPGDNVYRIGKRFGVPTRTLVRTNRIRNVREVQIGTRLWIPRGRPLARAHRPARPGRTEPKTSLREARRLARHDARRAGRLDFRWPVRGKLTSRFGSRNGRPHEGIDVSTRRGTHIRSAEAGRVIHSGRLGAYGLVVVVKHAGHYRSVYAHARRLHVRRGQFVEKGQKLAEVGTTGNSSGPHLHFEIRRGKTPRDPILYLP